MKKIEMLFYQTLPAADNTGFKYVLFEITTDESEIIYDWGFADWNGTAWDEVEAPAGFSSKVVWWANTVHPDLLMKEKSRIIALGS